MLEKYTSQEILLQASGNQMICFAALSDFLSPLFLLCNNRLLMWCDCTKIMKKERK